MPAPHHYAHAYSYPPRHPHYATAWPAILADTRRIIDWMSAAGIELSGPNGNRPLIDARHGIAFTGDPRRHGTADQFTLSPPRTPASPRRRDRIRGICTTRRLPYDLAVAAVLLRLRRRLPGLVTVTSNGRWDSEWAYGAADTTADGTAADSADGASGGCPIGARALIDALFDTTYRYSPLTRGRHIY
jgi:hypothetical protein